MTRHDDWIEALRADPDDATASLIYADWLDDHAPHGHGDLVRCQALLDQLPLTDPNRPSLEAQRRELQAEHGAVWLGPVPAGVGSFQLRHGVVSRVELKPDANLAEVEPFLRRHPVSCLAVYGSPVLSLATSPLLRLFRELEVIWPTHLSAGTLDRLLDSHHLRALTALSLVTDGADNHFARSMRHCPALAGLRRLRIHSGSLSDAGVVQLLRRGAWPNLEAWDVWAPLATGLSFHNLFRPDRAARWRSLALYDYETVGGDAVPPIRRCPSLRSLKLVYARSIHGFDLVRLGMPLHEVTDLDLTIRLDEPTAQALAAWRQLFGLKRLTLRGTGMTNEALFAILRASPHYHDGIAITRA